MHEKRKEHFKELPTTGYVFLFGLLLIGGGYGLDGLGYYVESGIVTALALVIVALVIFAQGIIWVLGALD